MKTPGRTEVYGFQVPGVKEGSVSAGFCLSRVLSQVRSAGGELPVFLGPANLRPYVSSELEAVVSKPIMYKQGGTIYGNYIGII